MIHAIYEKGSGIKTSQISKELLYAISTIYQETWRFGKITHLRKLVNSKEQKSTTVINTLD
jgi:hypothetical protein